MKKFTEQFDGYVVPGESISIEISDVKFKATIYHDPDAHIDDDDSHNVDQNVTGCNADQQTKLLEARRAWQDDEWFYCGVVVVASVDGIEIAEESLWSIEANYPESDNSYLTEVASDLLNEVIPAVKVELERKITALNGVLVEFQKV